MTAADGRHETAQVEGALVSVLAGRADDLFWRQCYARLIGRIRHASELAGRPEPDLRAVAALVNDDGSLRALVATAAGGSGRAGENAGAEVVDWYHEDWYGLGHGVRRSVAADLRKAAGSEVTVARRAPARGPRVRLGERAGPWGEWDTTTLPEPLRSAAEAALNEIDEEGRKVQFDAAATNRSEAEGVELRLLASAIAHTVAATGQIRDAGARLKAAAGKRSDNDYTTARASGLFKEAGERIGTLLATLEAASSEVAAALNAARADRKVAEESAPEAAGNAARRAARPLPPQSPIPG